MHPNRAFHPDDTALARQLIGEVGFGMVFLATPQGPRVAHTPLLLRGGDRLGFHLARGNALTRHCDGAPVLAVVNGPDAYVSPRWYVSADQVPTWNYAAAECEGVAHRLDRAGLIDLLETIAAHNEARLPAPAWTMDQVSGAVTSRLLDAIVGFEIAVTAWRTTLKLSQNKPAADRAALAAGLEANGSAAIATLMQALAPGEHAQ